MAEDDITHVMERPNNNCESKVADRVGHIKKYHQRKKAQVFWDMYTVWKMGGMLSKY